MKTMKVNVEIKIDRSPALLKAEQMIAFVLRYGVIFCAVVISIGLLVKFLPFFSVGSDSARLVHDLTSGQISNSLPVPQSMDEWRIGLAHGNPDVIISLGLWLLIGLPVLRVAMTVMLFAIELDWVYLGITLFVFLVLMSGIFFGSSG